jgi:hypothetical protein
MNKNFLLFSFLTFSIFTFSQENKGIDNPLEDKNELKINGLFFILGAVELDYEYLINEESGFGVDVLFAYDDSDIDINYYISPYYRQYFGKKPASGFFVEGFGMLNSVEDFVYTPSTNGDEFFFDGNEETVTDFALGIGAGAKFLTKRGFVAEISLGVGRNLFNNDRDYTIVGKGGISIGYRF